MRPTPRVPRALLILALAAAGWSGFLVASGGVQLTLDGVLLSSRDPFRPAEIAVLLFVAALGFSAWTGGRAALLEDLRFCARSFSWLATLVAVIVATAMIHRWWGATSFWLDEETVLINVRDRSFAGLTGTLWLGQAAPLGWLIATRAVMLLAGTGERVLHAVPLVFSFGALATAIWIGRRWLNWIGAFVLAWLVGFGAYIVMYAFVVKHYSADVCGALLLPALAAWALEGESMSERLARAIWWWAIAAVGLWLSNGAMLTAPAVAVVFVMISWRRDGARHGAAVAAAGAIWLAALGIHYAVSGRFALHNTYLRAYWAPAMPPASLGIVDRAQWALQRLPALADNPGGTEHWKLLWGGALIGWIASRRRHLAWLFGVTPVWALIVGAAGIVPLTERFMLWAVPALYVGIALLADRAASLVTAGIDLERSRTGPERLAARAIGTAAIGAVAILVGVPVGTSQLADSRDALFTHAPDAFQGMNDRAGVRWLMQRYHPGDVLISTHLGWPALWWYGNLSLGDSQIASGIGPAGSPLREVKYAAIGPSCQPDDLANAVRSSRRVLFYLGFRDVPVGFDDLLIRRLGALGASSEFERFSDLSIAGVIDLTGAPGQPPPDLWRPGDVPAKPLDGCITIVPARRW